jgi:hypothetical protein
MIKKWCVYFFLLSIALPGCIHQPGYHNHQDKQAKEPAAVKSLAEKKRTVTVWVHGTRLSKFVLQNFFRSIPGMQSPLAYNKSNNQFDIAMALFAGDSAQFPLDDMRMFGWSGALNHQARVQAAHDLYDALLALSKEYKEKYGFEPKFKILTHSHGGNVALRLAQEAKNHQKKLVIDQLIMLACPVQRSTMNYTHDTMFKRIISIYSSNDLIQVIDPQGLYEVNNSMHEKKNVKIPESFFSKRCFPPQANMLQIKAKRHGHGLTHINFIQSAFLKVLPHFLTHSNNRFNGERMKKFREDGFVFSQPTTTMAN